MASTVAEIMPPATPVPMSCRLADPAPVLNASGITPRMNASDVIRIGRNRKCAASSVASIKPLPCACKSLANSTMRMAFLADKPTMVSRPTLKNTSLGNPRNVAASSAPRMPSGTTRITATGMDQFS